MISNILGILLCASSLLNLVASVRFEAGLVRHPKGTDPTNKPRPPFGSTDGSSGKGSMPHEGLGLPPVSVLWAATFFLAWGVRGGRRARIESELRPYKYMIRCCRSVFIDY